MKKTINLACALCAVLLLCICSACSEELSYNSDVTSKQSSSFHDTQNDAETSSAEKNASEQPESLQDTHHNAETSSALNNSQFFPEPDFITVYTGNGKENVYSNDSAFGEIMSQVGLLTGGEAKLSLTAIIEAPDDSEPDQIEQAKSAGAVELIYNETQFYRFKGDDDSFGKPFDFTKALFSLKDQQLYLSSKSNYRDGAIGFTNTSAFESINQIICEEN